MNSFSATISAFREIKLFSSTLNLGFGFLVSFICDVERSVIVSSFLVGQSISLYGDGGLLHLAKQLLFPILTSVLSPAFS